MADLSHGLPDSEVTTRIANTREALAADGLCGLLAYGDALRTANVGYFTDFRPLDGVSDIAMGVVLLPVDGDPILFVGGSTFTWAKEVTPFEVRVVADLPDAVAEFARRHGGQELGLAGGDYIPMRLHRSIEGALGSLRLRDTIALARVKAKKSDWEVEQLRMASSLTDAAIGAIRDALADGPRSERELSRAAEIAMLQGGADAVGYRSMVQAGPRSAHSLALPTDRMLQPGDLVMTDIGARYRGYVADGGRGFGYGELDEAHQSVIDASVGAVEAGLAAVRPGITADALNAVIQSSLVESGYADYSNEAKGHGTGHGTGMDPEEELPWIAPGQTTVLEKNMVFTLKATITVPGIGGLRTERIVRVSETGCDTLDRFPMKLNF